MGLMTKGARVKLNLTLIFILLLLLAAVFISNGNFNYLTKAGYLLPSREFEVISEEPEPKQVVILPFKNILEKINEGRELLAKSPRLEIVERGIKKKEIETAVLDLKTGDIYIRRYWLEDGDLDRTNEIRTVTCGKDDHYPYLSPVDNPGKRLYLVVNWWNSYNSNLSVVDDGCEYDRYIVVANKVLINNDRLVYPQDKTGKKYSEIIYSPYSEQLHREEIVREGLDFLNEKVAKAFSELEVLKIDSHAFPGKPVTETIKPSFVKNIFINEQSDPKSMIFSADGGRRVAERVLVRLGMNKDSAFRFTYSPAGAFGLGQIMPQTYKNILHDYSEAQLIKDPGIGRADVLNAIKASILVLDDHFAAVVSKAQRTSQGREKLGDKTENDIEDIRAAIYNGGPGKYEPLSGKISLAIPETVSYLMKLGMIRELHLFD